MLQPFVRETLAVHALAENLLVPARSTKCLRRRQRKIVTRGEFNQFRRQAIHFSRITLTVAEHVAPGLTYSYHSAPFASEIASSCG